MIRVKSVTTGATGVHHNKRFAHFKVLHAFPFSIARPFSLSNPRPSWSCDDSTGPCENTFDCDIGQSCVSEECVVVEPEELRIEQYRANTTTINAGDGVEIFWNVVGADRCTINDDILSCSGATEFFPDSTTTYTLRGESGPSSVFRELEITVVELEEDGGFDAGPFDAGLDAGPFDAGPFDAGLDAGPFDAGPFDAGPPIVEVSEAIAFVVDVAAPEVRWTQTGAVSCTVDGMFSGLTSGLLVDPISTGAHVHTVSCQGSAGDIATTTVSVWWGDVVVADLGALETSAAKVVVGSIVLEDDESLQAFFGAQNVVEVRGGVSITNNTMLASVNDTHFGALVKVGGDIAINSNTALTAISMGALLSVGTSFIINNDALKTISMAALRNVGGDFDIRNNDALKTITTGLRSVVGDFLIVNNVALTGITMGALSNVGGALTIKDNDRIFNITVDSLPSVEDSITITGNPILAGITMGALSTVGGDFFIINNNNNLACSEATQLRDQVIPLPPNVTITPNLGACL